VASHAACLGTAQTSADKTGPITRVPLCIALSVIAATVPRLIANHSRGRSDEVALRPGFPSFALELSICLFVRTSFLLFFEYHREYWSFATITALFGPRSIWVLYFWLCEPYVAVNWPQMNSLLEPLEIQRTLCADPPVGRDLSLASSSVSPGFFVRRPVGSFFLLFAPRDRPQLAMRSSSRDYS